MATYVMSDIHGCYTAMQELLKKTGFDPEKDELIIAGDIVDRGQENYEMLEYACKEPKNVTFLMGNHDYDFIHYCEQILRMVDKKVIGEDLKGLLKDPEEYNLFRYNVIDHYGTVEGLIGSEKHPVGPEDFRRWKNRMSKFPYVVRREVEGKKYIIVHAGYISDEDYQENSMLLKYQGYPDIRQFFIWAREAGMRYGGEAGSTVIFGHTPTIADSSFYNHGEVFIAEKTVGKRGRKKDDGTGVKRFINIDCGCVFRSWDGEANLACIRLEDEKIFYLEDRK